MLCPWDIAPEAVRDYAAICGAKGRLSEGPVWDRYERELCRVVRVALELPDVRRSKSGELVYRVQVGVKLWLVVKDSGARPTLLRVAPSRPVYQRAPGRGAELPARSPLRAVPSSAKVWTWEAP